MAKSRGDFADILVRRKIVGQDQPIEAEKPQPPRRRLKLQDMLSKLGYATPAEVMSAVAEHHGMQFVDLNELEIPKAVIELVPESVARENLVLPLTLEGNTLKIITADNLDPITTLIQKLQFILNKDIVPVIAVADQITEAINRNYGQTRELSRWTPCLLSSPTPPSSSHKPNRWLLSQRPMIRMLPLSGSVILLFKKRLTYVHQIFTSSRLPIA